jgi:retron-type reverse transcriptase
MKTFDNFYEDVISLPNLYRAFEKAKKGKRKQRTLNFENNLHENLMNLHFELLEGRYEVSPYHTFYVYDYKRRKIMCPNFRDQVVQHALFNYMEQIYEKVFIFDSYACREGKGTHRACIRIKKFIAGHSTEDYFMKCDITKYFYSIDHQKLKELIRKKIKDEEVLSLVDKIIDSHKEAEIPAHIDNPACREQEKGIPIGNLMSQLFANIYLNELDYFVKNELEVKDYVRYVDDFVILGNNYDEIKEKFSIIRKYLAVNLFLTLEEKKVQINKISFGVDFVGYVCFKSFIRVRTNNYRRFVEKFNEKLSEYYFNEIPFEKIKASLVSYKGHLEHTNSERIKEKIEEDFIVIANLQTVQRGGNWNNGANAGPFCSNLNNDPSDVNNNIGFRCCFEQGENVTPSRRCYLPHAQVQLHSQCENRSRNTTETNSVIPVMMI